MKSFDGKLMVLSISVAVILSVTSIILSTSNSQCSCDVEELKKQILRGASPTNHHHQESQGASRSNDEKPIHPTNPNIFYGTFDTCTRLEQSIFGEPRVGSLSSRDEFCPGIKVYGGIMSNDVIVTTDVVLKVNNNYFSVRQLLDLGSTITPPAKSRAPYRNSGDGDTFIAPAWVYALCHGADAKKGTYCPWRRNWGVDSCTDDTSNAKMCVCGGGWEEHTSTVRLRHFICGPNVQFSLCKTAFYVSAPDMCAPNSKFSTERQDGNAWYDVFVDCGQGAVVDQDLCARIDKTAYLDIYRSAREISQDANTTRNRVNTYVSWQLTRDLSYTHDYFIQLSDNIWRDCLQPRLSMKQHGQDLMPFAREAVWSCDLYEAAHLEFLNDAQVDRSGQHQGATYYVTVLAADGDVWCLSKPLSSFNSTLYTGLAASVVENQLYWIPTGTVINGVLGDMTYCQHVYLGGRSLMQRLPLENVGRHEEDDTDFRVYNTKTDVYVHTCDV